MAQLWEAKLWWGIPSLPGWADSTERWTGSHHSAEVSGTAQNVLLAAASAGLPEDLLSGPGGLYQVIRMGALHTEGRIRSHHLLQVPQSSAPAASALTAMRQG